MDRKRAFELAIRFIRERRVFDERNLDSIPAGEHLDKVKKSIDDLKKAEKLLEEERNEE